MSDNISMDVVFDDGNSTNVEYDDTPVDMDGVSGGKEDIAGISRPKSAYQFHNQYQCPLTKEKFLNEGKNASMGVVIAAVSAA